MRQHGMLALSLIGAFVFSLALLIGPASLSVADLFREDAITRTILWDIRAPRSLCALLVGGCLGLAGAALQGLLRNPLADAGVLGLSGFSALGAVLAFALGVSFVAPLFALVFALGAAIIVVALGQGARNAATLILIGIGLSSAAGGLIALALNLAPNPGALSDLVNWTLGSVEGRSWSDVWLVGACFALGALILAQAGRGLQLLGLGDETARALGLNLSRVRMLAIAGAASCIGGATAIAGVIGFVGVAAPHLARGLTGHDPAKLLWPSALLGAVMLLCADLLVRALPTDAELKLGVAASLLGGPFFALIAARLAKNTQGGGVK